MSSPQPSPRAAYPSTNAGLTPPPSPPNSHQNITSSDDNNNPSGAASANASSPTTLQKTYKSATSLFLTRRLPDALALLSPILPHATPRNTECPRALRIKIWSLYLAVLDAAASVTPEVGRGVWGNAKWRGILKLVREGGVWEEVLRGGFEGGRVDGEVLCALVMLNLSHSPSQTSTQARIEEFLAQSSNDLSTVDGSIEMVEAERAQRLRVLELYILHVLPANGEWDYAREFTRFCAELGDGEKESFLDSLDTLEANKKAEEAARLEAERLERESLEREKKRQSLLTAALAARSKPTPPSTSNTKATTANSSSASSPASGVATNGTMNGTSSVARKSLSSTSSNASNTGAAGNSRPPHRPPHMISRLLTLTHALSSAFRSAYGPLFGGAGLARLVLFLVAFVWAGSKREVRDRLGRLLRRGAGSVARTVGMGVKVTYI